jgi:glycerol-3-phosphate acyltransferase PlsY
MLDLIPPVAWPGLAFVLAYLLGSLSFAVMVSRVMGLHDPRTYGSKNPGATNVLRSGNKLAAVITLVLDAAKGWLPVLLVRVYGERVGLGDGTVALVALGAFLGHLFPVFFGFKGGKGVATAAGAVFGVDALLGLVVAVAWGLVAAVWRYSSLASLVAAVMAPVAYLMGSGLGWYADGRVALVLGVLAMLLLWRHQANIQRLIAGTEPRLGQSKR